jgi:hypothetical protein
MARCSPRASRAFKVAPGRKTNLTQTMARGPSTFKRGDVGPLDPAVVKLIDALARSLAREDDARERLGAKRLPVEREQIQHER